MNAMRVAAGHRAIWWAVLVGFVGARLGLAWADLEFLYGPGGPTNPEPVTFGLFFVLPLVMDVLAVVGAWILLGVRQRGPGRAGWRLVLGALLSVPLYAGEALSLIELAAEAQRRSMTYHLATSYPGLASTIVLLMLIPIWALTSPRRSA